MVGRSGQFSSVGTTKIIKESVNQTLYETRQVIHRILTFNPPHTHKQTQREGKEKNMFACVCVCVCALERIMCCLCALERE